MYIYIYIYILYICMYIYRYILYIYIYIYGGVYFVCYSNCGYKRHQGTISLNTSEFQNLTISTISIEMPPHLGELPVQNWFARQGKYFPRPPVCSDRMSIYFGKVPRGATTKPFRGSRQPSKYHPSADSFLEESQLPN